MSRCVIHDDTINSVLLLSSYINCYFLWIFIHYQASTVFNRTLYPAINLTQPYRGLFIRKKIPVCIFENVQYSGEGNSIFQNFMKSEQPCEVYRNFRKFLTGGYILLPGIFGVIVEWITFRKFDIFRIFWKLSKEISVLFVPTSKFWNFWLNVKCPYSFRVYIQGTRLLSEVLNEWLTRSMFLCQWQNGT